MKRIILPVLIGTAMSLGFLQAKAQLKNTTAEDFEIGMQLVFQSCESKDVSIQPGGKNLVWDYSGLKKIEHDNVVENMVNPAETPYGKYFSDANIAEQYSNGKYVFLKKTATASYLLGYIDTANAMKAQYPRPVLIAKRPMVVGNKITDSFTTEYSIQSMDFKGGGNVYVEADGSGTLKLPNGTFNDVIRIKFSQTQNDVLIQYGSQNATEITTYVWFDNKHKSALLKITDVKSAAYSNKSVEYLLTESKK